MNDAWVWAPHADNVELVFLPDGERVGMHRGDRGRFEVSHPRVVPGQRYAFSLNGGPARPDPRSPWQPDGVHGPSCAVDFGSFDWHDEGFQQVPLAHALIYELHVGTFSESGTFGGVIEHLPQLKALGVTHVELMPVAHFAGDRGWGYDGVALFAPHTIYGGPQGLQSLVDACHGHGIAVILDVVYNHLGPSGNYLGDYAPYFTSKYHTPWGKALNFDDRGSDEVRRFICDNALHWLANYHIDGLRLDAVQTIFDQSAVHILEQFAEEVDGLSAKLGRHFVLIAESNLNAPRLVRSHASGGYGLTSQWSDDFHHALYALLTQERAGYFADYGSVTHLADVLKMGFSFRGRYSTYRQRSYGSPPAGLHGRHFVCFSQNHDQIGNRPAGDRLSANVSAAKLKVAAALTLLSPFVPMLFMGEEWGSADPFQYFTDHTEPELARSIRKGRQREFTTFGWKKAKVPDPQSLETFLVSKLDWTALEREEHRQLLDWHTALVAVRRSVPSLSDDHLESTHVAWDEAQRWLAMTRGEVTLVCNFAEEPRTVALPSGGTDESVQQTSAPARSATGEHGGPAPARLLTTGSPVEPSAVRLLLASHNDIALIDHNVSLPPWTVAVVSTKASRR